MLYYNDHNDTFTNQQFYLVKAVFMRAIENNLTYEQIDPNNKLYKLKAFIKNNMKDPDVQDFLRWLARKYKELIFTEDFINALESDDLKYKKIEKLCLTYPFRNTPDNITKLYNALYIEDDDYKYNSGIYRELERLFKRFRIDYDAEIFKKFLYFVDNSNNLPIFTKNSYKSISTNYAINFYLAQEKNSMSEHQKEHYNQFKEGFSGDEITDEEIKNKYKQELLENIGRCYVAYLVSSQKITREDNDLHISSIDVGEGLGYDIYYKTEDKDGLRENLIKVKTTECNIDNAYESSFDITPNEYNLMINLHNYHEANYELVRVYSGLLNNGELTYDILVPVDENTLVSKYNPNITYIINEHKGMYTCTFNQNQRKNSNI